MRFILGFIGAVFALILTISLISGVATYFSNHPAPLAAEELHKEPKELRLASDGPFGKFDNQQLQRGFQVYSEVCSACHSLKLVAFRDLRGIGYNDAEIKKIASDWKVQAPSLNPDTGEPATRKPLPNARRWIRFMSVVAGCQPSASMRAESASAKVESSSTARESSGVASWKAPRR